MKTIPRGAPISVLLNFNPRLHNRLPNAHLNTDPPSHHRYFKRPLSSLNTEMFYAFIGNKFVGFGFRELQIYYYY
jgi:hypothetical protein